MSLCDPWDRGRPARLRPGRPRSQTQRKLRSIRWFADAMRALGNESRASVTKMSELWLRLATLADRYGAWADLRSERDVEER
jgi:hypothetical protein